MRDDAFVPLRLLFLGRTSILLLFLFSALYRLGSPVPTSFSSFSSFTQSSSSTPLIPFSDAIHENVECALQAYEGIRTAFKNAG